MQIIPFNSRDHFYKSPAGAVTAGSDVIFRILLPLKKNAAQARLVIRDDYTGEIRILPMTPDPYASPDADCRKVTFTSCKAGLWFYFFEVDTPHGIKQIRPDHEGNGTVKGGGDCWQLTVYNADFTTPDWIKGGVIYQVFPDRFFNSGKPKKDIPDDRILRDDWGASPMWEPDEKGAVHRYDFFGGDLRGIEEKLDRLAELGVTVLYLNPIFEAHSNHRYDTADYLKVDPLLGSEDDFKAMCGHAEARGIRVILDGVFSHTGADSVYFNKFNRYPPAGAFNTKDSPYYAWFFFNNWPQDYRSWWGVDILPETNETHPDFLNFIAGEGGVAGYWLNAGACGWRLDVADELPDEFLTLFRKRVKKVNPEAFILGEVWEDASNKISYGNRRRFLLGEQLDSVMNYPFANAIIDYAKGGNAESLAKSVENILENYPEPAIHTMMNHIGTHDTVRAVTLLGGDGHTAANGRYMPPLTSEQRNKGLRLMKLVSSIQFTLPGVPSIYYGDEAGLEGGKDPFNRGCYPWGNEDMDLLAHYKALGKLRKNCEALKDGNYSTLFAGGGLLAFERRGKDAVLTVANRDGSDVFFKLPENWLSARTFLGNEPCDDGIIIPAYSASVLVLQSP